MSALSTDAVRELLYYAELGNANPALIPREALHSLLTECLATRRADEARVAELVAAREAGRREGLEQAAQAAGQAAWQHGGHDGYSKAMDSAAVGQAKSCVDAIRALLRPAPEADL